MTLSAEPKKSKAIGFAGFESMVTVEPEAASEPVAVPKLPAPRPHADASASGTHTSVPTPVSDPSIGSDSPQAAQQSEGPSSGWILAIALGFIVVVGVAVTYERKEINASPASTPQPVAAAAPRKLVVAALTANIREQPSAQSRLITSFKQGERIEFVDRVGTFTQVRLADKTIAFIASELVIPEADYVRLNGLSPQQYVDARGPERRIESLFQQTKPLVEILAEVLFRITTRDSLVSAKLQLIEATRSVRIDADEPAGIWYSLAARVAANSGQFDEAALNARAAVEADPMNPDYHVAFALSKYSQGQVEPVRSAALALAFLAPRATNTWMLFGLAEAMDDSDKRLDELAKGSFILAIKLSRNADVTRKYFKNLMAKSDNPRVQQLLRDAMVEEATTFSIFGFDR